MIYIVASIILLIQVFYFICIYRMLFQLKKRYKSLEAHISNMNNWVLLNNKSLTLNLENMKDMIAGFLTGGKIVEMNNDIALPGKKSNSQFKEPDILHSREQRFSSLYYREDRVNHVNHDDTRFFYLSILEELQLLNKNIGNNSQQPNYDYNNPIVPGNETTKPVNGWNHRVKKHF